MQADGHGARRTEPDLSLDVRRALGRREPAALSAFFDAYFDRVYGYVRRLVGDEHLAEDLTQDVFLQLYRTFDAYDPSRALSPWVFAVATNKVRDHWRSRGQRGEQPSSSLERDPDAADTPAETPLPAEELERLETSIELRQAIGHLPDGMRLSVLLRVYEGLSFQEIGAILGCNEATARKRYSRALERLREQVGGSPPLRGGVSR